MDFVVLESPFANGTLILPDGTIREILRDDNVTYARACMYDCLVRHGEAPYASHLLYTQPGILDDDVPEERRLGIEAGLAVTRRAVRRVFYVDRGFSSGMAWALRFAREIGQPCEVRRLGGQWDLGWSPTFSLDDVCD